MPSRRDVDILHALFMELARLRYGGTDKWPKVTIYQKTSSFFSSGAIGAFANTLNKLEPMRSDGIVIHPDDIRHAKTIGNIFGAILAAYKRQGWTITP